MDDASYTLTKFEYPALAIGSKEMADELEETLRSDEIQEHVQRAFYLDRVEFAALDLVQDGLSRDAEALSGLRECDVAVGHVRHEP